jgi:N-acetylglucosaminyldiphosphoundecaprenol N-acetyl-beta-D-mannosaminyltransferase
MSESKELALNGGMNPASAPTLADALHARPCPDATSLCHPAPTEALPIAVLGVPFDHVTIEETIARIDGMIASRRPHYVVTANVDFLVQAQGDVELRRILLEADLVLCDGTPVLWASRWLGNALPERVAGSDLAPALIESAAEKGHRIFFLGAAAGVAAEAKARLKQQFPTLNIVGTYAPAFSQLLEMDHEEITRQVRAANPDILLVSFGCPKQEKWIAMHHRSLRVPVAIGVGATLDFLAGRVKRAPAWMRHTGLEWFYRLLQEPKRLYRRYASDLFHFLPTLTAHWWSLAAGGREAATGPHENALAPPGWCSVDTGIRLTREALEHDAEFWRQIRQRTAHCLVDLSRVQRMDGTGVAFLIRIRKELLDGGRQLVLVAPSSTVRRVFTTMRLSDHFVIAEDVGQATRCTELLVTPAQRRDGTKRSLAWCGEIIAANVEDVWQMTTNHIVTFAANHATLIIIDLTRLRFIDSTGAALMMRVKRWAHARHVEVLFANAQPNVRNVLQLARLDQLILEGAQ